MEDNKKVLTNILQFPVRKKETEGGAPIPQSTPAPAPAPAGAKAVKKKRPSKKNVGGTVLAVILATTAINRYIYKVSPLQAIEMSSVTGVGRTIASDQGKTWERDAVWEKSVAESLASPKVRDIASTEVGRPATLEEKLRWGTLEEKYTISYHPDKHEIDTISFQDSEGTPSYILDRKQFLSEYGELFKATSTQLKSVEESSGKTVESYTLFGSDMRAKGEARFELDRHKRLLSLKVEPTRL